MTGPRHTCHWPDCDKQVPPALWGCKGHWFSIPKRLRDRIWATYRRGQEVTKDPSPEYLDAARAVQKWIQEYLQHGMGNQQRKSTKEKSMNDGVKPAITMKPVESSRLHSIGHSPETNTLAVCFRGKNGQGATYHYTPFTVDQFDAFTTADSLGRHFDQHIKGNEGIKFLRVAEPPEAVEA